MRPFTLSTAKGGSRGRSDLLLLRRALVPGCITYIHPPWPFSLVAAERPSGNRSPTTDQSAPLARGAPGQGSSPSVRGWRTRGACPKGTGFVWIHGWALPSPLPGRQDLQEAGAMLVSSPDHRPPKNPRHTNLVESRRESDQQNHLPRRNLGSPAVDFSRTPSRRERERSEELLCIAACSS